MNRSYNYRTLEIMKLFDITKNVIGKTTNGGNVLGLEVVEVVLQQCKLVDNQYHRKSECNFILLRHNKCYANMLNVEPSNLVFSKTYSTEFDDIKKFANQNCTVRNRRQS